MVLRAVFVLRAQALFPEQYRNQFTKADRLLLEQIANTIRDGIDQGIFNEVNPYETAVYISMVLHGASHRRLTTNDDEVIIQPPRALLTKSIDTRLVK